MSNVKQITDAAFDTDVIKSEIPVLVDFWAPWCGPCRMMAPVLDQFSAKYTGKIEVMKLNVDDNPKTASKYNIRSIPTLIMFKGGLPVGQEIGYVPMEQLVKKFEKHIQ